MSGDTPAVDLEGEDEGERPAFPPFPPLRREANAGEEPGGSGPVIQVLTTEDPQFWKNCPVEVGAVLELPTHRGEPPEVEDGSFAVFIHKLTEDESGLWLQVKFLGGAQPWSRDQGIKLFSRERRAIHVCLMGVSECPVDAEKTWHVERFTVFPPGVPPPSYVEKVKRKEWKKLYQELFSQGGKEAGGRSRKAPAEEAEVPLGGAARLSALRSRLQARTAAPAAARTPSSAAPARPARETGRAITLAIKNEPEATLRVSSSSSPERRRKDRSVSSMRAALAKAAAQQREDTRAGRSSRARKRRRSRSGSRGRRGRSRSRRRRRRRGDSRDSRSRSRSSSSSDSMLPPLQKKATRSPGSVLKMLLTSVGEALADAAVQEGATSQAHLAGGNRMSSYFQIVARPLLHGKVRDVRELDTLARCIDYLKAGRLPELGDALAGRFLAVESAGLTNNWQDAQHLEVIPARQAGLAAPAVLLQAQRHGRAVEKATGKRSWRPGGDFYARSPAQLADRGAPSGKDEKGRGKGGGRGKGKGLGKGAWRAPGAKGAPKEGGKDGSGAAAPEAK